MVNFGFHVFEFVLVGFGDVAFGFCGFSLFDWSFLSKLNFHSFSETFLQTLLNLLRHPYTFRTVLRYVTSCCLVCWTCINCEFLGTPHSRQIVWSFRYLRLKKAFRSFFLIVQFIRSFVFSWFNLLNFSCNCMKILEFVACRIHQISALELVWILVPYYFTQI